jgi:RimJ/RimL family protein N-acetyltransferase
LRRFQVEIGGNSLKKLYRFKDFELELISEKNVEWYETRVLNGLIFENQNHQSIDKKRITKIYLEKLSQGKVFKYYILSGSKILGIVSLSYKDNEIELGYYLEKEYRGLGVMSNTLREIINFLDDGRDIVSYTQKSNQASKKLLEKLDFYPTYINDNIKYYYSARRSSEV